MLKKITLFVILSCLGTNLFPQQNNEAWKSWYNNHPAIHFYVSLVCFNNILLAGGEGSILYKINSGNLGEQFTNLNMGPEIDISGVVYDPINNSLLVLIKDNITGKSYLYSVSADGKSKQLAAFDEQFNSVAVDNNNNMIYIPGHGKIITSTDGGKQFTDHNIPKFDEINDVIIEGGTPALAYILFGKSKTENDNGIRTTTDFINFKTPLLNWILPIIFEFADVTPGQSPAGKITKREQNAPIFAYGLQTGTYQYVVCRSTDNGDSWDSVFAAPQNQAIRSLSAGSNNNVIVGVTDYGGGSGEELYYTQNGGDTWTKGNASINNYIYSITHVSADSAYALGAQGLIMLTTDGGESWIKISDDHPGVSSVYFSSPSVGYAAGISGLSTLNVYKTTDAGDNWDVVYSDTSFSPSYASVSSIFFINDMTGFITGSKFIKTTDGGKTWNEVNSGIPPDPTFGDPFFQDVYFVNNTLGFAVYRDFSKGDGVIKTTDGGTMWTPLNIRNDKFDKKYIYFADENLGFASGYSTLYRTTNGGDNWDTLAVAFGPTPGFYEDLNSKVNFINSSTGFFGRKGHIFKTTDKGDTWTDAQIDDYTEPQQIQFLSDSIGYTICTSDTFGMHDHILYKTTDGGNSWHDLTNELPAAGIFSLFFTDENTGYLAGSHGILKTTSGGETITSVNEVDNASVPSGYKLYQNYPNPFNPTTKIRYSISSLRTPLPGGARGELVTLKVYDILGREVTTLVNKQQQPGNYEVEFNASNLSSGVYFYRIITNDFTATKKFVLLK